jgi:hypothetical protein
MYMLRVIFYNIACGYIVLFSSNIANIWYIASCLRRVFRSGISSWYQVPQTIVAGHHIYYSQSSGDRMPP